MTGIAIAGLVLSVGTFAYSEVQKKKSQDEAERLEAERGDISNPFARLKIPTLGAELQNKESARRMATQMESFGQAGSRGLAYTPLAARADALVSAQSAASLDAYQKDLDTKVAGGEIFRERLEENRYLTQQSGYASQYAYNAQLGMNAINQGAGILTSGFAEGGVFNRGGQANNQQNFYTPQSPSGFNAATPPNTNFNNPLYPQQLIPQTY